MAHGTEISLYSLSVFLLSYHEPTASISLQCGEESSICLLKRVRINEYIGAGRNAGFHGGKEYLVAGTQSGDLSLIESPFVRSPPYPASVTNTIIVGHTTVRNGSLSSQEQSPPPIFSRLIWAVASGLHFLSAPAQRSQSLTLNAPELS
jgi:hypothetical protein